MIRNALLWLDRLSKRFSAVGSVGYLIVCSFVVVCIFKGGRAWYIDGYWGFFESYLSFGVMFLCYNGGQNALKWTYWSEERDTAWNEGHPDGQRKLEGKEGILDRRIEATSKFCGGIALFMLISGVLSLDWAFPVHVLAITVPVYWIGTGRPISLTPKEDAMKEAEEDRQRERNEGYRRYR